jgi:hypothetical protein
MNGHHLIMGQLTDFISGQTLDDTLDERHRQQIGRLLVNEKKYTKSQITSRYDLKIHVDNKCAHLMVTYTVRIQRRIGMIIQYGPGSLVTRHRPTLAIARLVADYQVPVAVVTNGEQADILDGNTGKRVDSGLDMIPDLDRLYNTCQRHPWNRISTERAEKESRILMAFEVDGRCPCDESVCTVVQENKGQPYRG